MNPRALAPLPLCAALLFAGCSSQPKPAAPAAGTTARTGPESLAAGSSTNRLRRPTNSLPASLPPALAEAAAAAASGERRQEIRPYDKVITKDAKTQRGLFTVHRIDDKVYFEIPVKEFGKELLWVSQVARTQSGFGYGGGTSLGNRVVRWQLHNDKEVFLRDVKYSIRAEGPNSVRKAVEASTLEPIIRKFSLAAWATNKSAAVIDVTELFLSDVSEFSARSRLGASGADRSRSYLDSVKAFPDNIETRALITYSLSGGSPISSLLTNLPTRSERRDGSLSAVSVLLHHSMVRLPAQPMRPRELDERVGFFSIGFENFSTTEHEVKRVRYINRWRLEKKDPAAEVSEPKKPIVYYIGRGVPDQWRPWIKKGVEAWQPAFEKAGFKNAIIAKDAPSEKEDPNWDAEDARFSTIQWLPSTIENAMGPHVHDPRTGEILEADILMYHNILKLNRDWYFTQASPNDPRAQKLPLPDDLMGELLAYVVTHEVGHTLGFPHNMKASSAYSIEQLRDPEFTRKNGTEASIMDYGRFNYVAQPGDNAALIPVVGPYDFFAVEWGYQQFPGTTNAAGDKPHLDAIAARQVNDPMLRFGDPNPGVDSTQQTEDLSNDPVRATELGLRNIDRVMGYLVSATCRENEDYDLLRNMYSQVLAQRDRELMHVVNVVGAVVENRLWFGQADRVYAPKPADRQRDAVAFLNRHAFATPTNLLRPDVLARLEPGGAPDRILASQRRLLAALLDDTRAKRMAEHGNGATGAYLPIQLIADLRAGIWGELAASSVDIDLYRRNLQRAYVELIGAIADRTDAGSDLPGLARSELKSLGAAVAKVAQVSGPVTRAHLDDILARIERILDPRGSKTAESPVRVTVDRSVAP
ncbi:MAG: hypothetical protein RJA22_1645 [Verrucomicrobiota bacterium]|jgi:hypothetical protein